MASLKRQRYTRRLPNNAKILQMDGKEVAVWKDRNGRRQTGPVIPGKDGVKRVRCQSPFWTAKYRDGEGILRSVSTGCRDKQAAMAVLNEHVKRSEKVRSNLLTPTEDRIAEYQLLDVARHIDDYCGYLEQRRKNAARIKTTRTRLKESATACGFRQLRDLSADQLQSWLDQPANANRSAAVHNGYIEVWVAFGYWLTGKRLNGRKSNMLGEQRLLTNPFAGMGKADVAADRRRIRRALTEEELTKLLDTARRRPLIEAQTIRRGPRKGTRVANVRPEVRAARERLGRERALMYKTMVFTGLRRNELATLTEHDLELDDVDHAFLTVRAHNAKNRKQAKLPIRRDLAVELASWIHETLRDAGSALASTDAGSASVKAKGLMPIFRVPTGLVRILDRDLKLAGIPKFDDRGRSIDVHAMRTTFGTHLSKAGVSPRVAQAAMRHSDIMLTMNVYTDPALLDVANAVAALPAFDSSSQDQTLTPALTPAAGNPRNLEESEGNSPTCQDTGHAKENPEKQGVFRGSTESGREDLNLRPLRPELSERW